MKRKILITGCNGFIGSHLINFYLSKSYEVYGIGRSKRTNHSIKYYSANLQVDDMTDVYKSINPDIFIHCAGNASVGNSVDYPEIDFDKNVGVLYKALAALKRINLNPKFIFLSSAAVYGNPRELPIREESLINPISPYGLHKKMCEDLCSYYKEIKEMNIAIVRIFSTYGEGLRKQILWDMYRKYKNSGKIELFGTGNESRDFIYIDDVVQAIDLIIHSSDKGYIYNIANCEEVTINELAETFATCLGISKNIITFNGKVKIGDPLNWKADISKIKKLGYNKKTNLVDGVKKYLEWVKDLE